MLPVLSDASWSTAVFINLGAGKAPNTIFRPPTWWRAISTAESRLPARYMMCCFESSFDGSWNLSFVIQRRQAYCLQMVPIAADTAPWRSTRKLILCSNRRIPHRSRSKSPKSWRNGYENGWASSWEFSFKYIALAVCVSNRIYCKFFVSGRCKTHFYSNTL